MPILVVDNDTDFRDSLAGLLKAEGHEVRTAGDGAEALRALDDGLRPRVILLDRLMPKVGAAEFLWRLAERPGCQGIPVILMSSFHDEATLPTTGVRAFLKKPFRLAQLEAALRRVREPEEPSPDGSA